jgi:hypothetical protein
MANVSITTTYVGQAALPFVAPAILSADTLANGYISVIDNVRHEAVLRKLSGGVIAGRSCEFNTPASGELSIADVTLTTDQLQVNEQICNGELAQTWAAEQMRGNYASAPADYVQFLGAYVAGIVAQDVERNIWHGKFNHTDGSETGASYANFQGICRTLVEGYAAGNMQQLTGATVAITAATPDGTSILERLAAMIAEVPSTIAGDPEAKVFMSRKSLNLYYQALASTYNLPFLNDGMAAKYAGYDIIAPAGFPDDTFLVSRKDNMFFGTNLLTDHIEAKFLDLTGVTGDDVTRIVMLFDGGTQVADAGSVGFAYRTS